MRILAIGANGFIGQPLVRQLMADGHDVAVFHRGSAIPSLDAPHVRGDRNRLHEHASEIRGFSPEVIVDMILSSGEQAREVMTLAGNLKTRVVAISSMDVYRAWGVMLGSEPGGLEPMPVTEDSPLRTATRAYPPELVARMKPIFSWLTPDYDKAAVEEQVMSRPGNTVVRLPMVYGPGDPYHRLYGVIKRVRDRRPAIILEEHHASWRAPRGYVDNVANAIALATTSQRARGMIYHVCEEPTLSELEWQKKIAQQTAWPGKFVVLPKDRTPKHLLPPGNPLQHLVADSQRIRTELGYQEIVAADEAIRRTIAWEDMYPPTYVPFHQFDYAAEDAVLADEHCYVPEDKVSME